MALTGMYDVTTQMTWDDNDTSNNATATPKSLKDGWYIAYNAVLIAITIVCMFSMGTSIKLRHLKLILIRPIGPIIGAVCQLILMPACCCGYALLLDLPPNIAIGMVLVGSTPGGSISNIITFWCKADIILSVCMTTISTTLAMGFLPLNMFIYTRFWIDDSTEMPYVQMVVTLLYLWASVFIGYLVGRRWPKSVPYFTKIGSVFALVLILTAGVVQGQAYPETLDNPWKNYLAAVTMPIIGFVIGFGLAWIFCLGIKQRLAIGFETGIQNTALALTVIAITFPTLAEASFWSQFVILYTTFQVVLGIGTVVCIWLYNLIRYCETPCTPKESFGLAEPDENEGGKGLADEHVNRTITTDENDRQVMGLRMVSVVEKDSQSITIVDKCETASTKSDTGVSSLSGSTTGDVDGCNMDAENAVLVIDNGAEPVSSSINDEETRNTAAFVISTDDFEPITIDSDIQNHADN